MDFVYMLAIALTVDLALGDPPDKYHPVSWMGRVISYFEARGLKLAPSSQRAYGVLATIAVAALFAAPLALLFPYLREASYIAYVITGGVLLKMTFSFRGLREAAIKIRNLIKNSDDGARFELRALVSRDAGKLSKPQMISAVVESVAEGLCDSLVAPLFYFLIFGVAGAVVYRVVNTLDSRVGYYGKYEHLGRFPARADDVLNYIPARLAALMIAAAATIVRRRGGRSWRTAARDHAKLQSPNAGWPIAAIAGALGIQLEKPDHYRVGEANHPLTPLTITKALKLAAVSTAVWFAISFAIRGGFFVYTA